jgi:hypothetical protein
VASRESRDPVQVVTTSGEPSDPRLSPDEIEALFHFALCVHDHEARVPSQPIFWYRTDSKDLWRFWN